MISVERIMEYGKLDSEASLELEKDKNIDSEWPKHGQITAENVFMKYEGGDKYVLNNINFDINAGEKVHFRNNNYFLI